LNPPSPFLHDLLRPFYWAYDPSSAFGLALLHNGIGSTTFFLHEGEGVCAKGGEHGPLFSYEGIDNHPSVFAFLKKFCPFATAGESDDEEDSQA